ncbi:hypothetical protein AVEN_153323-1 [Araneus ventricosus]|uniref:Uncharacterized protein n=1 Tax=Araneus ventricosus TaxID=182803 RepID=A0A4Y2H0P1_ARAVE|nr:hypothetical protein AVEN_153323-1 [Araneus ventricosus]
MRYSSDTRNVQHEAYRTKRGLFVDGPCSFEQWSDDEDEICADNDLIKFPLHTAGGSLILDGFGVHQARVLHGGSSEELGVEPELRVLRPRHYH